MTNSAVDVHRYCGVCLKTLVPGEKVCPDGCAGKPVEERFTLGSETASGSEHCTENPPRILPRTV